MRTLVTFFILVSTNVAAPVPKELKKSDPFVGKWNIRKMIVDGETIDRTDHGVSWNIDGDHAMTVTVAKSVEVVVVAPGNLPMVWAVSSNDPRMTQLRFDTAHSNIEYGTGSPARAGKYSLDGDTLAICLALPGSPRPEKIEGSKMTTTWILKRIAK